MLQIGQLLILIRYLQFQGSIFSELFSPSSLNPLGFTMKSLSLLIESLFEKSGPLRSFNFL
uniref:Uncharacterized protein n=1 Tax=Arundo donax TaxID=35708 RepID=A0A0A9BT91_ARUDO